MLPQHRHVFRVGWAWRSSYSALTQLAHQAISTGQAT
jgi:hypothetical protein